MVSPHFCQTENCNVMVVLENALKKSRIISSERIISIAQLEELEVDEMEEDQLQEMAETFFDESTFKIFRS